MSDNWGEDDRLEARDGDGVDRYDIGDEDHEEWYEVSRRYRRGLGGRDGRLRRAGGRREGERSRDGGPAGVCNLQTRNLFDAGCVRGLIDGGERSDRAISSGASRAASLIGP